MNPGVLTPASRLFAADTALAPRLSDRPPLPTARFRASRADSSWAVVETVTVLVAAWAPPFDRPRQTPLAPAATATAAAIERGRVLR
ncbi:hypothetical protein [Streptomyces sp. NPDC056683]|uniref:hypothetical protein n=1 Tax=Streptomyces sp. NPDC056683 TaxID=3345910 RepID=UPI0036CB6956